MRIITFLLCFLTFNVSAQTIIGKAVKIKDGDSFELLSENNTLLDIRLFGIDCPEKGQDFGKVAKMYTADFLKDKNVLIKLNGKDRYGRNLAFVFVNNICLNEALLKAGLAWHFSKYFKSEEYAKMQSKAQKSKVGLWSLQNPIAPWDFRKLKRKK